MISAEQFAEWKTHPVTKEIFAELKGVRSALVEQLVSGDSIDFAAEITHGVTNRIVGQITGIDQVLNISYSDDKVDNENVSSQSGY